MSDEPQQNQEWCAPRRVLLTRAGGLAGLGGLAAAGLLAACGNDADSAHVDPADAATPKATPPGGLVGTSDVPVGGGAVIGSVLVVQPVAGTFKAFDAACPHKGVQVSPPKDGVVECPAHKSVFNLADGARISGPATRGLTEIKVTVDGPWVVKAS